MTAATSRATGDRESWVDIAKGLAIVLVALFHSVIFFDDIGLAGRWSTVAAVLDTFRMPLFFFTAGLFASKALSRSFSSLFWTRLARLLWLYLLWCAVWAVAFQFIPVHRDDQSGSPVTSLLLSLVWPNASTWFVYGLAIYFAAAWSVRRLPPPVQLLFAFLVVELFGTKLIDTCNDALDKIGLNFLYFLLATKVSSQVRAAAPRATWWSTFLFTVLYGASAVLGAKFDLLTVPGARVVIGLLAIAAGCSLAMVLSRSPWTGGLRALGRNTLPVYLVHFYVVLIGVAVIAPVAGGLRAFALVVPVAFTALSTAMSLAVHRATRRATWLWGLPSPLARRAAAPRAVEAQLAGRPLIER